MPRYASPQALFLAALVAGAVIVASPLGVAAKLDRTILKTEQNACQEALQGEVDRSKRVCRCMADNLSEALDDDAYLALARLIHLGEETDAGLAAQKAALDAIAVCLES